MTEDERTLVTADEIAAWIERLWRRHGKRISVTARSVKWAIAHRGLPAERIGRAWVIGTVELEAWWLSRRKTSATSATSVSDTCANTAKLP